MIWNVEPKLTSELAGSDNWNDQLHFYARLLAENGTYQPEDPEVGTRIHEALSGTDAPEDGQ